MSNRRTPTTAKRAKRATEVEPDELDDLETPEPPVGDDEDDVEDFDAFWSARKRKRPGLRIFGELVELPPSLPLQFELEARKVARSKRDEDVRKLVGILFGDKALERWSAAGLDLEQFQVLLAWAPRKIAGQSITLAAVADEVAKANAANPPSDDEDGEGSGDPS